MTPRDRETKIKASQQKLNFFTKRQDIYVYNRNLLNSDAAKVTDVNELKDFVKIVKQAKGEKDPMNKMNVHFHGEINAKHQNLPLIPNPLSRFLHGDINTTRRQNVNAQTIRLLSKISVAT